MSEENTADPFDEELVISRSDKFKSSESSNELIATDRTLSVFPFCDVATLYSSLLLDIWFEELNDDKVGYELTLDSANELSSSIEMSSNELTASKSL